MNTVTSSDGTAIAYEKVGQGPPIVLVDGAFVYRAIDTYVTELAGLLADQFTVYTYERRGRGNSGDTAPYSVAREIDDLEAIIKEAGGSACVMGMSSGAVLTLDAAAAGLPITKLALYEPPFIVDDSHAPRADDYLPVAKQLVAEGRKGDAIAHALTKTAFMPAEMVEGMRTQPFFAAMEAVGHTVFYDGEIMEGLMSGKPLPTDRWSSVSVPTLIFCGDKTEEWVHRGAEALREVLPSAEVQGLEGRSHHDIAPEVVAPVLRKHFAG
jgi:pimeloyl-ACP methyl ester carboxylesterase